MNAYHAPDGGIHICNITAPDADVFIFHEMQHEQQRKNNALSSNTLTAKDGYVIDLLSELDARVSTAQYNLEKGNKDADVRFLIKKQKELKKQNPNWSEEQIKNEAISSLSYNIINDIPAKPTWLRNIPLRDAIHTLYSLAKGTVRNKEWRKTYEEQATNRSQTTKGEHNPSHFPKFGSEIYKYYQEKLHLKDDYETISNKLISQSWNKFTSQEIQKENGISELYEQDRIIAKKVQTGNIDLTCIYSIDGSSQTYEKKKDFILVTTHLPNGSKEKTVLNKDGTKISQEKIDSKNTLRYKEKNGIATEYNEKGILCKQVEHNGNTQITTIFNQNGNKFSMCIEKNGNKTIFLFDENGKNTEIKEEIEKNIYVVKNTNGEIIGKETVFLDFSDCQYNDGVQKITTGKDYTIYDKEGIEIEKGTFNIPTYKRKQSCEKKINISNLFVKNSRE